MSRDSLLPAMAAHVMTHGLGSASLRPLARAAGTSDRMLLYHFGTKQALIEALLDHLSVAYIAQLDAALAGAACRGRGDCFRQLAGTTRAAAFGPVLILWWQIVAGAAQGDPAFRASAGRIVAALLGWIEARLPPGEPDRREGARAVLAAVEGVHMLDAIGAHGAGDAAVAGLFPD